MELLEYQAKELFRMVGIPILPSQTIKDSRKIKQLQIPYPVVLKSQVRSGGRGKAGGVRFVANTIDAIAAARTIFNLSILGEYPEVILAEAHYNTKREFFLAIVLDYDLQCPVLLGSAYGGMNVDSLLSNLQQVVIDGEFSLFYARRLVASMGFSGQLICSVSEIIAKMYCLFQEKDLDLIEINPLGVNTKGELMALDGKITINDRALARQPIIQSLNFSEYQKKAHNYLNQNEDNFKQVSWHWLDWQNKTGKIAIICNDFDLASLTWDLLNQNKITPAAGIVIDRKINLSSSLGDDCQGTLDHNFIEQSDLVEYQKQLEQILNELKSIPGLKAILINIWETEMVSQKILQTLIEYMQSDSEPTLSSAETETKSLEAKVKVTSQFQPQFILRLLNAEVEQQQVSDTIYLSSSLETAISQAIAVVKSN